MTVVDDILAKCEEIRADLEFITTLAGKATDPKWLPNDPTYTHLKAVYMNARAALITKTGELPVV